MKEPILVISFEPVGKDMLYLEIDRSSCRSLSSQICVALREKILSGELAAGARLPSTRALSLDLHVSRNTILTAYDMLVSEGLAGSRTGSGIYVSPLASQLPKKAYPDQQRSPLRAACNESGQSAISFDSGLPALSLFPRNKWNRAVTQAFFSAPDSALGYDDPMGRPELRESIATWLLQTRGIHCTADQILITSGAKQGLTLIAKSLLDQNSLVLMEDPCNANIRQIVSYHTNHIIPIPVDNEGLCTGLFPNDLCPSLIFSTPSRQFPMGSVLSMERRLALIEYANKTGSLIVEDDYDSEFRYDDAPVRALFELGDSQVIYVGTFSKLLFPSLRLGYLVLPQPLVSRITEWKRLCDHHSNSIYQLALSQWIESGELERHIARMKRVYARRRQDMLDLLDELFSDCIHVFNDPAGLHLVAEFSCVSFTPELISRIQAQHVVVVPVKKHSLLGGHDDQLILGYAHLEPEDMRRGLTVLRNCVFHDCCEDVSTRHQI